jgi:CheY-like chemotaxis protein
VIIAASPVEALEVLSQMRPDAVLLDVQMADPSGTMTSGLDLLTSVRARSGCADLPVLVLTGHFLTSGEEMAIQCLGATVIYKPVELHTLVDHLARCGAAQGAFVRADS